MLHIEWTAQEPTGVGHHLLAVAVPSSDALAQVERRFGAGVTHAARAARFRGEVGEKFSFLREQDGHAQHVLLLGAGATTPA
ncbi:MAG TPA: hypothetical protein VIK91_20010, partial [Nannocystis sp.]